MTRTGRRDPSTVATWVAETFTAVVGLAARRILRELGLVAVSPRWGVPERTLGAEWEHMEWRHSHK